MTMDEAFRIKVLHDKIKHVENCNAVVRSHYATLLSGVPEEMVTIVEDLASTAIDLQQEYHRSIGNELSSIRIYGAQP